MSESRRVLVNDIAAALLPAMLRVMSLYGGHPQDVLDAVLEVEAREVLIPFLSDGRADGRLA